MSFEGGPSKWESARAYQAFGEELKRADGNSVKGGFCNDPDRVVSRIDWLENKLLEFSKFLMLPIEGLKRRFSPWLK